MKSTLQSQTCLNQTDVKQVIDMDDVGDSWARSSKGTCAPEEYLNDVSDTARPDSRLCLESSIG